MSTTFETAPPRSPEDPEEKDIKKKLSLGKKIGLAATGLALTGAAIFGGAKALEGDNHEGGPEVPSTSAPANPGETSTTPSYETVTEETVEFTAGDKHYVGIDGVVIEEAALLSKYPQTATGETAVSSQIVTKYANALQVAANLKTTLPAEQNKQFVDKATKKLLFKDGAQGPLTDFISELHASGKTIEDMSEAKMLNNEKGVISGYVEFTVVDPTTHLKTKVGANFGVMNDFGAWHSNGIGVVQEKKSQ